jgi:hypothetical protein
MNALPSKKDLEIQQLKEKVKHWQDAWYDLKGVLGCACWREYYQGVNDALEGRVFDPEYGKRFYGLRNNV